MRTVVLGQQVMNFDLTLHRVSEQGQPATPVPTSAPASLPAASTF
ncbi:hypothetical protein [Deinococcus sp. Marseille-Q6407]